MDYASIFKPETLAKLNKQSQENLKKMLGDKSLMQTMIQSQQLLGEIAAAEAPYKEQLEELAKEMVEKLYPVIEEQGIVLDAKIVGMGDVNATLDEVKNPPKLKEGITPEGRRRIINSISQGAALKGAFSFYLFKDYLDTIDPSLIEKYNQIMKNSFGIYDDDNAIAMMLSALAQGHKAAGGSSKVILKEIALNDLEKVKKHGGKVIDSFKIGNYDLTLVEFSWGKTVSLTSNDKEYFIPQGMDKTPTDNSPKDILPNLRQIIKKVGEWINKYGTLEIGSSNKRNTEYYKNWLGKEFNVGEIEDQGINPYTQTTEWGFTASPKQNSLNESQESGITIRARAINFPMLVHEIIKGLYELISLQGFKGTKDQNQAVVDRVDTLKNEPEDIKYGRQIFEALNDIYAESGYEDSRIREHFFAEIYQLEDEDFLEYVENAINGTLTPAEKRWTQQVLKEIQIDLKDDDFKDSGIE